MKHIYIILFLFFTFSTSLSAQVSVTMTDQNVATCNGTLYDSGGQGATGYQNDEYFVLTICPDQPGDVITLDFLNFALDQTNTATGGGNNADNLIIYDGNNTTATSLGTYTGNQLQGLFVTCTSLNTSGCLTLVFTSNNIGTGVFAATISCATPCQRPTVVMSAPQVPNNPLRICDGDTISFDGSASYAANGFNIVDYIWNWGDGSIDTNATGIIDHSFNNGPGEYLVNLFVVDDNNCISTNLETIQVLTATTPVFVGTSPDTLLCLSESTCLSGTVSPTTWTAQPVNSLGGATYLPDNVGQCFTATLDFQAFTPGQTLNNINDLISICVSMEHSYMGDLVASIICPNGQSVIMHQQNGGGTNLGDPNQIDDSTLIGVCQQYCFSPTATNGTWVDNSQFGTTPNTYTNSSNSQSLIPGTYESLNPLSGLVGCPLNGTWTLEFCDLWGADDGFVCDWDITLQPSLYPALTSFTPSIGNQCDSSFWTATGPANSIITSTTGDCNQVCMTPTAVGVYDYSYSIIDNHGCTFDTTITVTVDPGPIVDLGNDTTICVGNPTTLNASPSGGILPPPFCNYTLNMYDSFGDGWNGFSVEVLINGVSQGLFTFGTGLFSSASFAIAQGDAVSINTVSGFFDNEVSYEILDCSGVSVFQNGVNYGGLNPSIGTNIWSGIASNPVPPNYNFNWTPATGLSDPTIQMPNVSITSNQQYIVEVWETGHPNCSNTDTINVIINPNIFAGEDSIITICYNDPMLDLFTQLGGTPSATGSWFDAAYNPISNMIDPSASGTGGVFIYIVNGGGTCPSDSAMVDVTILQQGNPLCGCPLLSTTTSIDASCFGSCDGSISIIDIAATEYSFDGSNWGPNNTSNTFCAGTYDVYVAEPNFGPACIDTFTITISEPPPLTLNVTSTNVGCFGDCDGTLNAAISGGVSSYILAWSGNLPPNATQTGVCAGSYDLTVTDTNGCSIDTIAVQIIEPPLLVIDNITSTDETCFNTCDGSITILSTNASSFSIDGGASFQANGTFNNLCTGSYSIVVVDTAGCTETGTAIIDGPPSVFSDFTASPQPTTVSNTEIIFNNLSQNATSYLWSFGTNGGLGNSIEENPSFKFPEIPGNYETCLIALNSFACPDTSCQQIIINNELLVYIPNAFTPEGNGLNDVFIPVISGNNSVDYEFMIFDRWGALVFNTSSPTEGWDGKIKGFSDSDKSDVFVWKLVVRAEHDNTKHEYIGHVTVIK